MWLSRPLASFGFKLLISCTLNVNVPVLQKFIGRVCSAVGCVFKVVVDFRGLPSHGKFPFLCYIDFSHRGLGEQDIVPVFNATGLTSLFLLAFLGFTFCNFHWKDYFCRKRWAAPSTVPHNKGDAGLISYSIHFQFCCLSSAPETLQCSLAGGAVVAEKIKKK